MDPRDRDQRLAALDELLAEVLVEREHELTGDDVSGLLHFNRDASRTRHGYEVARVWLRALLTRRSDHAIIALFAVHCTEAQLWSLPRALRAGADPLELLTLGVHGLNCQGEDLPVLDAEELAERLRRVGQLLQRAESPWLVGYGERVLAERRRRRQAAPT